uniref:Rs2 n=1 Tax=Arundo donax TaxID=35708 RepID=A0A0A9DC15_ARUDO
MHLYIEKESMSTQINHLMWLAACKSSMAEPNGQRSEATPYTQTAQSSFAQSAATSTSPTTTSNEAEPLGSKRHDCCLSARRAFYFSSSSLPKSLNTVENSLFFLAFFAIQFEVHISILSNRVTGNDHKKYHYGWYMAMTLCSNPKYFKHLYCN